MSQQNSQQPKTMTLDIDYEITPTYRVVNETQYETTSWIKILTGSFSGVLFEFKKLDYDSQKQSIDFQFSLLDNNGTGVEADDETLHEEVGLIVKDIVYRAMKESIDNRMAEMKLEKSQNDE